jgi:hypothetical protein
MIAKGKCVRPEIKFKLDEDGGHAGYHVIGMFRSGQWQTHF